MKLNLISQFNGPKVSAVSRFWAKVDKRGPDECWEWQCHRLAGGRAHFNPGGGLSVVAARFSWLIHNGRIPAGIRVLHICDNPGCVNPAHLFLGTDSDNMRDCVLKGRKNNGNSVKTHCLRGHPLSGQNLVMEGQYRRCRICLKAKAAAYRARRRRVTA